MKEPIAVVLVEDMIESIDKIMIYLESVNSLEEFLVNEMAIDAVIRNYEILGEASSKISPEIKDTHKEIPWRQMIGLRNLAIHEYHRVDPVILWEIAHNYFAKDRIYLEQLLADLKK